jgi:hypothetical protein
VRARDCVSVALAWRSHEGTGQRRRAEGSRRNMREQRGVVATASHWAERAVPSSPLSLSLGRWQGCDGGYGRLPSQGNQGERVRLSWLDQ